MVAFGYTLMTEQRGPRELVSDAVAAEQAGFDFEVISDHYFPWLDAQGHAPNAWAVLGAVAAATQRVPLMTYVTCPIMRYHPAVVAQQAATVALLAGDGRFTLGLGAGENLNEHVVGRGWPPANVRHEMLAEAVEIIAELFDGGYVNTTGRALPGRLREAVGPARSAGCRSPSRCRAASRWRRSPRSPTRWSPSSRSPSSCTGFDDAAGVQLPKIGQQPICWGPDRDAAVATAPTTSSAGSRAAGRSTPSCRAPPAFAAATQFVRPDDVAEAIPCGPDVAAHVEAVRPFVDAGFTHVALVQIGGRDPGGVPALRRAGAAARAAGGVRQARRRRSCVLGRVSSRDRDLCATAPVSVRTSVGSFRGRRRDMTSTDATQAVKALWWLVLIRGVLAVLFGLYALFSPAAALLALVFVFGFYAIMDGVAAIAVGFRHRRTSHWGWHVVQGVVSLIAGLIALFWPGPTLLALVLIIAVWSIVLGVDGDRRGLPRAAARLVVVGVAAGRRDRRRSSSASCCSPRLRRARSRCCG